MLRENIWTLSTFLFLSLNEGFGYPPLEAMRFGTPVVASPLSAIHEVCQNSVEYIDPRSVHDIKRGILRILMDSRRRDELQEKGIKRVAAIKARERFSEKKFIRFVLG